MPPFSSSSPVEEIKSRIDIVDLIQEYIQLKPGGANWRANCPFHQEKTPSFMVSRDKQIWHCFGCNEGGDIFTFVQKIEGMEFPEALRVLAKKANVQLPSFNPELQNQKTRLLDLMKSAVQFYQAALQESADGKIAREYLARRGVKAAAVETFQLGYSPDAWSKLNTYLVQQHFTDQEIFLAGLTIKRERGQGYYDRFRGRLMFPLRDIHGNVIGFGARKLKEDDDSAKYINSPQSAIYDKGGFLYGLDQAKQFIREQKVAVIVEGYMDAIASHQAGVCNVVASSGTALTDRQVKLLKRFTATVALAFDADLAGMDASQRGIDIALREEMDVKVITLPFGKDPDELIAKDPSAWSKAVGASQGIMEYTFDRATKGKDLTQLAHKKELVRAILRALSQLPDPIEQVHYLQKLSAIVGVDEQVLREKFAVLQGKKKSVVTAKTVPEARQPQSRLNAYAERLISGLLKDPSSLSEVMAQLTPEVFEDPHYRELYNRLILAYTSNNTFDLNAFTEEVKKNDPQAADSVALLLMRAEREFEDLGEEAFRKDIIATSQLLLREFLSREVQRVSQHIGEAERRGDSQEMSRLTTAHRVLTDKLVKLS